VRSYLNVPMMSKGELIGTLNISSDVRDGLFGEDLAAAREVADLLTVALVQSDLRDELRSRASDLEKRVSERTATLARSEARFRSLIDDAPDPILVVGPTGTIALANYRAESIFGYDAQELIGVPLAALIPEQARSRQSTDPPRFFDSPAVQPLGSVTDMRGRRKDGTEFPADISLSFTPEHAGEQPLGIAFVRDVTRRVRMQEDLVAAKEEAERASRAKDRFLSQMSHELRTPLNSVIGFAQLLELEVADERQAEDARRILKGGRHLLSLIDEILEISRISAKQLELSIEPVSIGAVVNDAVDVVHSLAADRGISILVEDPNGLYVLADRLRLTQVLLNLLSNAVKYNRERGEIRISCFKDVDRLKISVADTGLGIPPERQHLLFTPFERLGAEASGVQGTGLGLALTKSLIDAMGGSITADSVPGEGSVFSIDLALTEPPMARHEREAIREETPERAATTAGTILYVEDNLANLELVERILTRRPKIGLLSAIQGRLGLDLARIHLPGLILLDLHLPDMSGEEVLRELRQGPETREIPVVIVSADANRELEERVLASGADAYITKPIDLNAFLGTVDRLLR
jgi:PAS domain S-box-containing protein